MRIPRKQILSQKKFIHELNLNKFIHYRELNPTIDRANFQTCTKVDFKAVEKQHDNIRETWSRLMNEKMDNYYFKSKSRSEYFIDKDDNVYRFSNHWGAVASCEWTREGEGQLMMSVFDTGDWEIGVANLKDFEIFRRSVDRKVDYVVRPEWIVGMQQITPIAKLLSDIKSSPEFNNFSKSRKKFVGENFGYFRKHVNMLNKFV